VTVSDEITETWTAVPDYFCEVTTRGQARSVDRVLPGGRRVQGKLLAQRRSNRDYPIVDVYNYDGRRVTRTVHSLQMLAFAGPCPPGQETRHLDGNKEHNFWAPACPPGNLVYGTKEENAADKDSARLAAERDAAAIEWLGTYLRAAGGTAMGSALLSAAEAAGFPAGVIYRVRSLLGVTSEQVSVWGFSDALSSVTGREGARPEMSRLGKVGLKWLKRDPRP
jgi:hypothetical protein